MCGSFRRSLANANFLSRRWYWWADVPIASHLHVYAMPLQTIHGEPSVQYRGIFINDETPALLDWAHEKFGPKLNAEFYKKVFELLLRLKVGRSPKNTPRHLGKRFSRQS
jgi:hypothetical protein